MSSIESLEQKIDLLTKQILLLASNIDRKAKVAENGLVQANQSLAYAGKSLGTASQDIQSITSQTMRNTLQMPVDEFEERIKNIRNELLAAANHATNQIDQATKKLNRMILFAFAAFTVAGIVCMGAFMYAYYYLDQKIEKTEWISSINAAVAKGNLTNCPTGGGACVNVEKKLIRIDK